MKGFIPRDSHPVSYILLLLGYMVGGVCVSLFLFMIVLLAGYQLTLAEMPALMQNITTDPRAKGILNVNQALTHFFGFTVASWVLLLSFGWRPGVYLSQKRNIPLPLLLLVMILVVVVMPANSWMIEMNARMDLPDVLQGLENWMKSREDLAQKLTHQLTQFDSVGEFLLGMIVIALIPAVGEELVFRGIGQKQFMRWFRNPHVAIWLTAFIFGAIHLQFYGLIPRVLLGALFGYLYWWSGNIWVPILAHFMNNGFTVLMMYLLQRRMVGYDIDTTQSMPLPVILFSIAATAVLLFYLRRQFGLLPEQPGEPAEEKEDIYVI